jgi:hypothetical protein
MELLMRPLRILALLGLLASLLQLAGCLFDARDPEPPSTVSINYLPRNSPSSVWENCRLALINKDASGWDANLGEEFTYTPDTEAQAAYPGVDWGNWGKEAEMGFINNWFANDVTITADLLDDPINTPNNPGGNEAIWQLIYFIEVTDNISGTVTKYRGRAELRFAVPTTDWALVQWVDEGGENDPDGGGALQTMGFLRGAFAP